MTRLILYFNLILIFITAAVSAETPCAYNGKYVPYLNSINCANDFNYLKGPPLSQKYGNVESIKVIYKIATNTCFFANSTKYHYHYNFAVDALGYYGDGYTFNATQYKDTPLRQYVLANLNYYTSSGIYTLDFFAGDEFTDSQAVAIYRKITESTYFGNKISILVNSPKLVELKKSCGKLISTVNPEVIYKNQKFQSLTNGTAYGHFVKVNVDSISKKKFNADDILLLDGLPNEVPVVGGILTSEFQTPLCHVSLLCSNRGTPNASSKDAWNNKKIAALEGKLVKYKVTQSGFTLDVADSSEAVRFNLSKKVRKSIKLTCNETVNQIQDISNVRCASLEWAGGKASNFGELTRVTLEGKKKIQLPENAFVIPFYFYREHIRENHLQPLIDSLILSSAANAPDSIIANMLKRIRAGIRSGMISFGLIMEVETRISRTPFTKFRFRSSTNAEDIPGFNGAGLYVSRTGILHDSVKTFEKAIKDVWANLWDDRAFAEREYFHIDENSVAMGILVHRAFETEKVNGVAITRNIYREDYPGFTVNAQKDEISVVFPPDSVTCDQFLIFNEGLLGEESSNIDYITHSSENSGRPVLSLEQIQLLSQYLEAIKRHFYWKTPLGKGQSGYEKFAMDVEFKIDSKTNKLYVKQARLFK